MNVKDLKGSGLLCSYDELAPETVENVKCLLLDNIIALITGAISFPGDELEKLKKVIHGEAEVRAVWPLGTKTSLEMAGFLNGLFQRYAEWGDTYRRKHGVGGHPGDQVSAILALCDDEKVSGKKIIELLNLSYGMWAALQEGMLTKLPYLDYTTTLSLTTPVIAAVCGDCDGERIQDALNLSASGGAILFQVRPGDITNLKSAATGYAIARALWCYRMSDFIKSPASMFSGKSGWYNVYESMDGELTGLGFDDTYNPVEVKSFPMYNAAQTFVECGISLNKTLAGKTDLIDSVLLHVCKADAEVVLKPNQPVYPKDQPEADHHTRYCFGTALVHGILTPFQFEQEYLNSPEIRRIIDITDIKVMDDADFEALGGGNGACIVDITMKDGTKLRETRRHPAGVFTGMTFDERKKAFRAMLQNKIEMVKKISPCDIGPVADVVFNIENYTGPQLIDAIQKALSAL